jgi:predicted RNA-binding Zn-ribbon protein involved in translation (DUF1610 family)
MVACRRKGIFISSDAYECSECGYVIPQKMMTHWQKNVSPDNVCPECGSPIGAAKQIVGWGCSWFIWVPILIFVIFVVVLNSLEG